MRYAPLFVLLALAACSNPRLSTGLTIGTGGLSVSPVLSGNVGDATVSIQP